MPAANITSGKRRNNNFVDDIFDRLITQLENGHG